MKIVFLFDSPNDFFVINYFEKYKIQKNMVKIGSKYLSAGLPKKVTEDFLNGVLEYKVGENNIFIYVNTSLIRCSPINLEEFKDFDKIIRFTGYTRNSVHQKASIPKIETILINYGERLNEDKIEFLNQINSNKVLSCGNCPFDLQNVFFDYKLSFIHIFFSMGYEYLNFTERITRKDNLMGLYLIKGYKRTRDETFSEILEIANFEIKNYSEQNIFSTYKLFEIFLIRDSWFKNHVASFTDYQTSVCGYIFETLSWISDFESEKRLEYLTEKTLKGLLFSKFNIPFILDCNPYSFIDLLKDGYWFLNSEFFDYNENESFQELTVKMKKSLLDSIKYLNEINHKFNGDLDLISKYFTDLYGNKMQNNFKMIYEYINYPDNAEAVNFILS